MSCGNAWIDLMLASTNYAYFEIKLCARLLLMKQPISQHDATAVCDIEGDATIRE
jgi:hypothetical protein